MLERVVKIMFVTFLALYTLYKREHVMWLMFIIVVSIGFYGVKGGVFTIVRGGENLVWGPPESFIKDNNALALAVIMTIPLLAYFYIMSTKTWMRAAIVVSIGLCAASALGSYSRGGLLAIIAMSGVFVDKVEGQAVAGTGRGPTRPWLLFFHAARNGNSEWIRSAHMNRTDLRVAASRRGPC